MQPELVQPYGIVLLVKILLVGVIVIIGGINKFSVIPYMNNIKPGESSESMAHGRKLLNLVTIEAGLGFVVLLHPIPRDPLPELLPGRRVEMRDAWRKYHAVQPLPDPLQRLLGTSTRLP